MLSSASHLQQRDRVPHMLGRAQARRASRLSGRRGVERSCAWTARILRMVCDNARLPAPLAGPHLVVFACLMLPHWLSISKSLTDALIRSRAVYFPHSMLIPQMWSGLSRSLPSACS
jgi:hypothetical protein